MESPLLQRIVGAIVLVTLGVIFIPTLLDGSGYKAREAKHVEVKDRPTFPALVEKKFIPIPTPLNNRKPSQTKENVPDSKPKSKKANPEFALQVGAFDTEEKAIKLRDKLRDAEYTAFVHVQPKGKNSFTVRIGPELERSVLEKIKQEVNKAQKIDDAYIDNHPPK